MSNQKRIQVAVIEDEQDLRNLITLYINHLPDYECKISCESVESFLKEDFSSSSPEIILCDIGLPGMSGIDAIKILKDKFTEINIVMLTSFDDSEKIFRALCAGAVGYLLKKSSAIENLKEFLDIIKNGGSPMTPEVARKVVEYFSERNKKPQMPLTDREYDIVQGLVDGLSYKMIAAKLNISHDTVRQHIKNTYRKLDVNSKAEVITKSLKGEI